MYGNVTEVKRIVTINKKEPIINDSSNYNPSTENNKK